MLWFYLQPISWKTVAITFGLGGGIMLWFHYAKRGKELGMYNLLMFSKPLFQLNQEILV
jgi:hypothetical protein